MDKFEYLRKQMIDRQLVARGLLDQTVLDAVSAVLREKFIPKDLAEFHIATHRCRLPRDRQFPSFILLRSSLRRSS